MRDRVNPHVAAAAASCDIAVLQYVWLYDSNEHNARARAPN